jgi:uncharacterized membrane protein YraQ (UPF0718 family)
MRDSMMDNRTLSRGRLIWLAAGLAAAAAAALVPIGAAETARFVAASLWSVSPLVVPGIVVSAWVSASGGTAGIARAFEGRLAWTVLAASAVGAVTPVCGITVLPLMAGLLASGVPLAPVLAFWLSSPVTDPAMFATTAATLGWTFAIAKTLAALGLGLLGGAATAGAGVRSWIGPALRSSRLVAGLGARNACAPQSFDGAVWATTGGRARMVRELWWMSRLVVICLVPAFAAEHLLHQLLGPEALAAAVGTDAWWAVPLAVFVGAPAYLDGYAALPLIRGLMDHGMAPGAAMAFVVSGSAVSIWGAMAIFPVLRLRPFLVYLALAVIGSLLAGWAYALAVSGT